MIKSNNYYTKRGKERKTEQEVRGYKDDKGNKMKKVIKFFFNLKTELEWLENQKGWMLVETNGIKYSFVESSHEHHYEYVYFEKSSRELDDIKNEITDRDIEFVCKSSSWALFRKDAGKGDICVYVDGYHRYKTLMEKSNTYLALGSCYLGIASSQIAIKSFKGIFSLSAIGFYLAGVIFFLYAFMIRKYAKEKGEDTYAERMKKEKRKRK